MMSLKKTVFSAALLAAGSVFAAGHEAIHLEHPTIWYAFDNPTSIRTSSGSANLTFENDGGEWAFVANGDVGGSRVCHLKISKSRSRPSPHAFSACGLHNNYVVTQNGLTADFNPLMSPFV